MRRKIYHVRDKELRANLEARKKKAISREKAKKKAFREAVKAGKAFIKKKHRWENRGTPSSDHIYIITSGDFFKVGISCEPKKRLIQVQTGNPQKCRLRAFWATNMANHFEKILHRKLKPHSTSGEWFSMEAFEMAFAEIKRITKKAPDFESIPPDSPPWNE